MTADYSTKPSLFGQRQLHLPAACASENVDRLEQEMHRGASDGYTSPISGRWQVVEESSRWLSLLAARCHLGSPFTPNEAVFVRHHSSLPTRPPAREARYYTGCVASIVLSGRGSVAEHVEHDRELVVRRNELEAGDVLLQRGWSPIGYADPRPFTRIEPRGELTLLRLRHNIAAQVTPSSWLDRLTRLEIREAIATAIIHSDQAVTRA